MFPPQLISDNVIPSFQDGEGTCSERLLVWSSLVASQWHVSYKTDRSKVSRCPNNDWFKGLKVSKQFLFQRSQGAHTIIGSKLSRCQKMIGLLMKSIMEDHEPRICDHGKVLSSNPIW